MQWVNLRSHGQSLSQATLSALPIMLMTLGGCMSYAQLLVAGTPLDANMIASKFNFSVGLAILLSNLFSFCPYTMNSADMTIVLFMQHVLGKIDKEVHDEGEKTATMFVALHVCSAFLTGLFVLLGKVRAAVALAYLPYPVVAGFLAIIGLNIVKGSVDLLWPNEGQSSIPLVLALVLTITSRLLKHVGISSNVASVLCIMISLIAFHVGVLLAGQSAESLVALGWLSPAAERVEPLAIWSVEWQSVRMWHAFPDVHSLPLALVCCISRALTVTGIEAAIGDTSYNIDDEMTSTGIAACAAATVGGLSMNPTSGMSMLCKEGSNGDKRIALYTAVVVSALFELLWTSGIPLGNFLPRFLLGGLLMMFGIGMLIDWGWVVRARIHWTGVAIIYSMLLVSLFSDLIAGVVLGLCLALCSIIYRFAFLDVLKYHVSGVHFRSGDSYTTAQRGILRKYGTATQIIGLTGFLFEGVAIYLGKYLREVVRGDEDLQTLVLDFFACQGMNDSACAHLVKSSRFCAQYGVRLAVCNMHSEDEDMLKKWNMGSCVVTGGVSDALRQAEHDLLVEHNVPSEPCEPRSYDGNAERLALEQWIGHAAANELLDISRMTYLEAGCAINDSREDIDEQITVAVPGHSDVQVDVGAGNRYKPAVLLRTTKGAVCPPEALIRQRACGIWRTCAGSVVLVVPVAACRSRAAVFMALIEVAMQQQSLRTHQLSALYTVSRGGGWHGVALDQHTRRVPTQGTIRSRRQATKTTIHPENARDNVRKQSDFPNVHEIAGGEHKVSAVLSVADTSEIPIWTSCVPRNGDEDDEEANLLLNRMTGTEVLSGAKFYSDAKSPPPRRTLDDLFALDMPQPSVRHATAPCVGASSEPFAAPRSPRSLARRTLSNIGEADEWSRQESLERAFLG